MGLNKLKVGTRLGAGFTLLISLTLAMTWIGYAGLSTMNTSLLSVTHDKIPKIALVNEMRDAVRFQSMALRDIVLQQDLSFKRTEINRMKNARETYQLAAENLMKIEPDQAALLQQIRELEERVKNAMMTAIDLSLDDMHEKAGDSVRGAVRGQQSDLIEKLDTLLSHYERESRRSAEQAENAYDFAWRALLIVGLVAAALGVCIAVVITLSIVKPLQRAVSFANGIARGDLCDHIEIKGADETSNLLNALNEMKNNLAHIIRGTQSNADSVAKLAGGLMRDTHDVAQRAQQQSDRVSNVSTAVEQVSASIQDISRGATGVLEAAHNTDNIIRENHALADSSAAASVKILTLVESAVEAIHKLSDEIKLINEVTDVINSIADQTNLLALNATIEAARAGEHGRGFSLVADEVRVLSKRTAESTADIANMVKNIKLKSTEAVDRIVSLKTVTGEASRYSNLIRESFNKVVDVAAHATKLAKQISESTQEQTVATEDTANNMHVINQLTQENATTVVLCSERAAQLEETASSLRQLVSQFKLGPRPSLASHAKTAESAAKLV